MWIPFENVTGETRTLNLNISKEDAASIRGMLKGNNYLLIIPGKGIMYRVESLKIVFTGKTDTIPKNLKEKWDQITDEPYYTGPRHLIDEKKFRYFTDEMMN